MEAIDPRLPKKPSRMREPDPRKPPETFLTANQVASRNFVLLFTGEGNTEVWDPTGLDVTFVNVTGDTVLVGTTFADQRQLIYNKTINGLVLEDDRNAMAASFRRRLRDGRVRRRGRLMAMMTETEIRQMDGEYSTPLFKIWEDKVFNITEFLHTATEEEKDAVMSSVPGQPEHLDPNKLPQGSPILERLNRYLCAMVRPETCTSWNQVHNNPQLFTKDELRMHDNPDDGIYIAIEGVVYDITDYRQHHPAADTALAGLFGHDATEAFSKAHPNHFPNRDHQIYDHFPNYDFQVYGHTVRNVGRMVEEWDATTAIPANCVVLHGHALFLPGAKAHWGAADLTRQLTHPAAGADGAARARELQDYYDTNRFFYTRAKMVTPEAKDPLKKSIAFPELRRHQDYRAAQGKWVRDMGTDVIYDITSVLRHPDCFPNVPAPLLNPAGIRGDELAGCSRWLEKNLKHRQKGRYATVAITPMMAKKARKPAVPPPTRRQYGGIRKK
ncbi:FMN-dependent dehydrogenase [Apiospora arundinis]